MTIIESTVTTALQDIWNWLQGLANPVEDSLGTLGTWIAAGIQWLADKIHDAWTWFANQIHGAITWLADRLHDAYNYLANWVGSGLQWIGAGLSWIGQHIYAFGQWIWNGLCWIARTAASAVENFINWVWKHIVDIWNWIVDTIEGFINAMNDHINSWLESARDKFVRMIMVNTTLEAMFGGIDALKQGNIKGGVISLFGAPLAGIFVSSIADAIVPRPHTTKVMVFPTLSLPKMSYSQIAVEKPPIPTKPSPTQIPKFPITPTTGGYVPKISIPNYVESGYVVALETVTGTIKKVGNTAFSDYFITIKLPKVVQKGNNAMSDYFITFEKELTISRGSGIGTGYQYLFGHISEKFVGNAISGGFNVGAELPIVEGDMDIAGSGYNVKVYVPVWEKVESSIGSGFKVYLSQSGYNTVIYESFES